MRTETSDIVDTCSSFIGIRSMPTAEDVPATLSTYSVLEKEFASCWNNVTSAAITYNDLIL